MMTPRLNRAHTSSNEFKLSHGFLLCNVGVASREAQVAARTSALISSFRFPPSAFLLRGSLYRPVRLVKDQVQERGQCLSSPKSHRVGTVPSSEQTFRCR
jgi:hypothetical protein